MSDSRTTEQLIDCIENESAHLEKLAIKMQTPERLRLRRESLEILGATRAELTRRLTEAETQAARNKALEAVAAIAQKGRYIDPQIEDETYDFIDELNEALKKLAALDEAVDE